MYDNFLSTVLESPLRILSNAWISISSQFNESNNSLWTVIPQK